MDKSFAIAIALMLACVAGCGDRSAADDPAAAAPQAAEDAKSTPTPSDDDEHVARRFGCQAETEVALLDDGSARVSLPAGERHSLARIADSDPPVYTGDSLYFTIGPDAAYLSQQDGMRELACTEGS